MIQYIIQVVAFQLLFLVTYDLFLKKETFFNWNRAYLICSSLVSFLLPFIKIESFQHAVPQEYIILLPEIVLTPHKTVETMVPSWNWYLILGIVVSSILFCYKISQLVQLKLKGIIVHQGSYKIIKLPNSTLAFSIFNYVFVGNDIQEEKLEDILSHELVHIREKHSLDLLYFEVLRILCWFNPLVYIYQKRISELHEFIADATVVKHKNKTDYYEKLLAEVFQTQHFSFTNQFFKHSLIKKRIRMLAKQKSRQILKLKYLVFIPVIVVSLLYTSCEESTVTNSEDNKEVVDVQAKKQLLQQLIEELNTFNESQKPGGILSKEDYEKQSNLVAKISQLLGDSDDRISSKIQPARSYEEYVAAREKSIADTASYDAFEKEAVEFTSIDKAPVFPGCEGEGTLESLKDCFIKNITNHINKNFNTKLANEIGLEGVQKIFTKFIVDKNGEIKEIQVRAPHPQLEVEVERVLSLLPILTPAEKDGKTVSLKYVLPIVFKVQ